MQKIKGGGEGGSDKDRWIFVSSEWQAISREEQIADLIGRQLSIILRWTNRIEAYKPGTRVPQLLIKKRGSPIPKMC